MRDAEHRWLIQAVGDLPNDTTPIQARYKPRGRMTVVHGGSRERSVLSDCSPRFANGLQRWRGVRTLVDVQNIAEQTPGRSGSQVELVLWQRSLAGDGEAFGLLFDRHRDRVLRHASRLAGSHQDAEDVTASAFLELWRLRHRVRLVDGSMLPWLLATTTNVGLNAARSRRRYQRFLERLPRTGQQPDIAESASVDGIDPLVREAMRSLRPKDAQLLGLVALEGYTVGEAAACLELSPEAARARLHRARRRLRDRLGKEPAFKLPIGEEGL
jgi:RNA polymerase sigma-70 factor (ECF subfamily)